MKHYEYAITNIRGTKEEFKTHVASEAVDGWEIVSVAPFADDGRYLVTWRRDLFPNGASI